MAERIKKAGRTAPLKAVQQIADTPEAVFDPGLVAKINEIVRVGANASAALELIIHLAAELITATDPPLDRIKLIDKLINTARALIETRIKDEESAGLAARLDQLEERMDKLGPEHVTPTAEAE
jgi:hypothetical protein